MIVCGKIVFLGLCASLTSNYHIAWHCRWGLGGFVDPALPLVVYIYIYIYTSSVFFPDWCNWKNLVKVKKRFSLWLKKLPGLCCWKQIFSHEDSRPLIHIFCVGFDVSMWSFEVLLHCTCAPPYKTVLCCICWYCDVVLRSRWLWLWAAYCPSQISPREQ